MLQVLMPALRLENYFLSALSIFCCLGFSFTRASIHYAIAVVHIALGNFGIPTSHKTIFNCFVRQSVPAYGKSAK
jgi:hypothetical protein